MAKLKKDQILGIIGLVIAAFVAYQTSQLQTSQYVGDPGPKMFPYMASILVAICSIVLVIKPTKGATQFLTKSQWLNGLILFVVYVLTVALLWLFGFLVAVPVTLFVITFMFSKVSNKDATIRSRLIQSFIYAVAGGAILYLLYIVALDASMPKGLVWKMLK